LAQRLPVGTWREASSLRYEVIEGPDNLGMSRMFRI
jgi:hypothetical protein